MGIQINGITDTISATDGGLAVSGQQLTGVTDINASGIVTATQVNVGTGVTIHSTNGVQVGGNLVHSTGLNINQINVTGIVTANQGYIVGTGASVFSPTANTLALGTNGSERVRVSSAGSFAIGTSAAVSNLVTTGAPSTAWRPQLAFQHTNGTQAEAFVGSGSNAHNIWITAGAEPSGDPDSSNWATARQTVATIYRQRDASHRWYTDTSLTSGNTYTPTERVRIDSSGRLLVGTSTARSTDGTANRTLQIEDTGNYGVSIIKNSNDTFGGIVVLGKSRGTAIGSNTVVQSGDALGLIQFMGADGNDMDSIGAKISAEVDGTPGANDMPGRLVFSTSADGASSPTERLRIDNQGRLGLNITTQSTNPDRCFIFGSASDKYALHLSMQNNAPSGSANLSALRIDGYGGRGQGVYYGGQIDVSQIDVGTCYGLYSKVTGIYGEQFAVYGEISKDLGAFTSAFGFFSRVVTSGSGGTAYLYFGQDNTTTRFYVLQNGGIGNFQANNVNLSDRNAKKDIIPASNTWDCIKQWEIVNYRYKDQPDDADLNLGVIAQQVAESCPEVITVFEEAKDDHPEKLGVKEQQMYWMAIKALQEAQQRIETLEAKVATLESK